MEIIKPAENIITADVPYGKRPHVMQRIAYNGQSKQLRSLVGSYLDLTDFRRTKKQGYVAIYTLKDGKAIFDRMERKEKLAKLGYK